MCGAVLAPNKEQALVLFRRALEDASGACGEISVQTAQPRVDYINVYVAPRNIRIKQITAEDASIGPTAITSGEIITQVPSANLSPPC
jgi:hypothetical protein